MTAESEIFVDSQDSVIITTEGSLTETTPDSSSTLFVMWQTLERKKDGIAEKGLFDEFVVLILIQFCGVCILNDLADFPLRPVPRVGMCCK